MLQLNQVAERLACSISNVYSLVESGKLGSFRVGANGKGYRVSEDQLNAFLEERRESRHKEVPAFPKKLNPIKLKHLK